MLSRIEVIEPPNAAPTEIEASMRSADSGSIVKVNGIRIAIATGPPRPGSTPTQSPITVPRIMNRNCFHCSAAHRPTRRLSNMLWRSVRTQRVDEDVTDDAVGKADADE